ncbi:MAG: transcription antitermination protein NusB [Oscillospiraceae bacterium]|nr:transcription antitermination protein NusB [Oscillospiraceae bacterium]
MYIDKTQRELLYANSREAAFMLVFEKMFSNESAEDIIEAAKLADEYDFDDNSIALFRGVAENTEELDCIISAFSPSRAVSRIGKVPLAVMRIAVYECNHTDTPVNIAVSEAVRIAQIYSLEGDVKLVNGLLGSFSRSDLCTKAEK